MINFDERGFVHFPDAKHKELNKLDTGICLVRVCSRSFDSNILKCHVSLKYRFIIHFSFSKQYYLSIIQKFINLPSISIIHNHLCHLLTGNFVK